MKDKTSFIIVAFIVITVIIGINQFLNTQISTLKKTRDLSEFGREYGDYIKDSSIIAKDILDDSNDLFLFGSSEMAINVKQNSIKLFPIKGADYNISCFGRGYVQNLQQATYIGGSDLKSNQKVAYILSLQWFDNSDGVKADKFAANFSEIQFYNFLNNPKISEENKQYYAKRVYSLLEQTDKYQAEALYARLYSNPNLFKKICMFIMNPYYKISNYLSTIKDKALIYEEMKKLPQKKPKEELEEINWGEEQMQISEKNRNEVSTNQFHLTDDYYDKNIKEHLDYLDGYLENNDTLSSVEMDDFKFFLSVCEDLNIKPYIIMPPVNGWYYDYLGLNIDRRNEYYNSIDRLSKEQNLDVLDLRQYEYKQGFLIDVMHLGEEGWLKVSEGIYNHFNEK
ncbi:D-alanyl-lipoteichoic acid biosynthesis protein DltD [uncultured Clostridium sp.]|uniref:D-alanyl-lipoteichoic acid biosynthesis protein DltD n=1 Tax=uncultured Clostridium sp. TaxID=59620 RepID=UPI0025E1B0A3|nr:D-alanyl-lipoteichoic acid biosynthesis protein DltD [uncultured Clostridium sp.]